MRWKTDGDTVHSSSGTAGMMAKMNRMEGEIQKVLASDCPAQTNDLSTYMQTLWWPNIQYQMARIPTQEQVPVQQQYARLQYMLGMRKCPSTQETFYQGECHEIGVPGNPCPRNQQLYDRPDNNGYCYCQRGLSDFVYMDGQCYQQNEQGPCDDDQWLVVREDRTPACQQVPRGCPADGQHVYWSCGGNTECQRQTRRNSMGMCSRLGSQQPSCGVGAKLYRTGTNYYCGRPRVTVDDWEEPNVILPPPSSTCSNTVLQVPQASQPLPVYASLPQQAVAISGYRPCHRGYNRDWTGRCRRMVAPRY
ncbi:uncharacterized protein LOC124197001 isoform X2 [Daphnia pulex]|uniref:uncharacterized protein LOC124197001 isoform X2 n=1 Tax=Daphnia pulex TaxID=6669 RepID=UPI001EDDD6A5|nr:uncharacterized protein LOC124197001 isoform X2 [Daphnia pulex]